VKTGVNVLRKGIGIFKKKEEPQPLQPPQNEGTVQ
jgi:hypothetical protein